MRQKEISLGTYYHLIQMKNKKYNIAIVISDFNRSISEGLLSGAKKAFNDNNGHSIKVYRVPGAFEIPATVKKVADKLKPDAIITLGSIIKGETKHFDFIAAECTRAIQNLTSEYDFPILFGVLTTNNKRQAIARSSTNNKGYEVMNAAFEMINLFKEIEKSSKF